MPAILRAPHPLGGRDLGRRRATLLALALGLGAGPLGATHITDRLAAGLYQAPTDAQPRRVLISGTPVEILERGERYCRVRLGDGDGGWVECQYLSDDKTAHTRLLEAQAQAGQLWRQIQALEASLKEREVEKAELQTRLRAADQLLAAKCPAVPLPDTPNGPEASPCEPAVSPTPEGSSAPLAWAAGLGLGVGFLAGWARRRRSQHQPPITIG